MTKTNTRSRIVSILLVLMMLLTMVPTTARAEESKTGTLKITVDVQGLYGGGRCRRQDI